MFDKRLLLAITLDKKKLKRQVKGSCEIQCMSVVKLLTNEEYSELRKCINRACELLREAYIRSMSL